MHSKDVAAMPSESIVLDDRHMTTTTTVADPMALRSAALSTIDNAPIGDAHLRAVVVAGTGSSQMPTICSAQTSSPQ